MIYICYDIGVVLKGKKTPTKSDCYNRSPTLLPLFPKMLP